MFRSIVFAALVVAAPACAQEAAPAAPGGDMRARLLAMDTDHDGKWSKAEWLAGGRRERGFALMDADSDGILTADELRAGVVMLRARRGTAPAS